jgi:hypothetical protein
MRVGSQQRRQTPAVCDGSENLLRRSGALVGAPIPPIYSSMMDRGASYIVRTPSLRKTHTLPLKSVPKVEFFVFFFSFPSVLLISGLFYLFDGQPLNAAPRGSSSPVGVEETKQEREKKQITHTHNEITTKIELGEGAAAHTSESVWRVCSYCL